MSVVVHSRWKALRCNDAIVRGTVMGIGIAIMGDPCIWMIARAVVRPLRSIAIVDNRRVVSNLVLWTWTNPTLAWGLVRVGLVARCRLSVRARVITSEIEIEIAIVLVSLFIIHNLSKYFPP
jgi:hypothetical protein